MDEQQTAELRKLKAELAAWLIKREPLGMADANANARVLGALTTMLGVNLAYVAKHGGEDSLAAVAAAMMEKAIRLAIGTAEASGRIQAEISSRIRARGGKLDG